MNTMIDVLEHGFGFPVDSSTKAVQAYNVEAREGKYANSYATAMKNILGIERPSLENEDHARIQLAYVIEVIVRQHNAGETIDPVAVYEEATARARKFAVDCSWAFAKKEEDLKLDAAGNAKPKKGAKQVLAYEVYCRLVEEGATRKAIIQAFQDEVDMTKAGATTYFYNMKKKYEAQA